MLVTSRAIEAPSPSDAALQACLTLKALFGLPLRHPTGLVASLLTLAGLIWAVPDFSTLSRRPSGLNGAIPYRQSTGALPLLIDIEPWSATGSRTKARGDQSRGRRQVVRPVKHGASKPRQGRKVPLGIDADTQEIRAIEVTGSRAGPSRPIALQSPAGQRMRLCCPGCSTRLPQIRPSAR